MPTGLSDLNNTIVNTKNEQNLIKSNLDKALIYQKMGLKYKKLALAENFFFHSQYFFKQLNKMKNIITDKNLFTKIQLHQVLNYHYLNYHKRSSKLLKKIDKEILNEENNELKDFVCTSICN